MDDQPAENGLGSGKRRLRVFLMAVLCLCGAFFVMPGVLMAANRSVKELLGQQEHPVIVAQVLKKVTPANSWIKVDIAKQRAYLMVGDEVAIDTPIATGKRDSTPRGEFTVLEKDKDHRSSLYGNFVDSDGSVVRAGVSTKTDVAPSGTRYTGAPMWNFMRLTWSGIGMHTGHLPGYPASHGCIRMPKSIAPLFYDRVKVGTRAVVQ